MTATEFEDQSRLLWTEISEQLFDLRERTGLDEASCAETLDAMRDVPRHPFVPDGLKGLSYANQALPIGFDQTISQPFVVAAMTAALALRKSDRVLEVGTGCGYQTAILSRLAGEVYSIEIVADLQAQAKETLAELGVRNVTFRVGDGHLGWPEAAPFDAILAAAAADDVPPPLLDQLAPGGRMILPVGARSGQVLVLVRRTADGAVTIEDLLPVRFVPMVGDESGHLSS